MKNHEKVNGKLLQTNKRFSHLKQGQKDFISNIFREKYHQKMDELNTNEKLPKKFRDEVVSSVYLEIEKRDIWLPFGEVEKYCLSKITKTVNKYNKKQKDASLTPAEEEFVAYESKQNNLEENVLRSILKKYKKERRKTI